MAKVELQVEQWQERGIQVMVLLSFLLQLVLLVLAEFRRRKDSGVLRVVIWSAYMLADSVAIYTLGHLSVTSRSDDHELMAFWAPFLLLHLGGQDNITAYAIEDNRLWLRHLQALAVQVAAAAYILYESTVVGTHALLRNASILMFMLGVVKYGERVWALKHAGTSKSGRKYRSFHRRRGAAIGPPKDWEDTEGLLRTAHLLLDIPKDLLQGPLPIVFVLIGHKDDVIPADELYKVVEMQISLMHDVVYSKAEVIHTWYGLCIHVISPVFTTIAYVLFHRLGLSVGHHHYSGGDVAITYVLLGGAVMMEIISVFRAMFSRWPSVVLWKMAYDNDGQERCIWVLLARAIGSIRRFVLPKRDESRWWWSDSMGQHNLIDLCVCSRASRASRIASWMGVEDWFNTIVYSSSICVSTTIKKLVVKHVLSSSGQINLRGHWALAKRIGYEEIEHQDLDMELDESIVVWHIATDIYLRWYNEQGQAASDDVRQLVKATETISNYMVFLLAARPYMLPGSPNRTTYVEMCYCLTGLKYNTTQDLASLLTSSWSDGAWKYGSWTRDYKSKVWKKEQSIHWNQTLHVARELARELVSPRSSTTVSMLEVLAQVWMEMLCYAGYRCNGYSHAKQLSNGGELLTIVALVVEYKRRGILKHRRHASTAEEEENEEKKRREIILRAIDNLKAMIDVSTREHNELFTH